MPNPDSSTPSIQALDLAVKPAGYSSWDQYSRIHADNAPSRNITLAYAADLDKADKQNREALAELDAAWSSNDGDRWVKALASLRANLLPEPIDPDLLEAREMAARAFEASGLTVEAKQFRTGNLDCKDSVKQRLEGIRRGRELAKEQDRG